MPFWLIPITASQLVRVVVSAVGIALAFCYVLGRYWAFYHLGVGGGFVVVLLLPFAIVTSVPLAIMLTFLFLWRRLPAQRAIRLSVGVIATVALAILGSEIHRSHNARSSEGLGAGDLAPFFRALVTLR